MRTGLLILGACIGLATASAGHTQPVKALQGKWEGTCTLGGRSAVANVFVDQQGARMDDVPATHFTKGAFTVAFDIQGRFLKKFSGKFSPDTSVLSGDLTVGAKVAKCVMNRKITEPNRVCIRNLD